LERLRRAFVNYWDRAGMELVSPEFPLVAVIFADQESYRQYSQRELGDASGSIVGYYSLETNRVTMYDLTGVQALLQAGNRRTTAADINRMLAQPRAEPLVATVVHEATHQIAFNCGMHARFADIPLWVSEGVALFFETPDLSSSRGWRGIGAVNRSRLATFRQNAANGRLGKIESLIDDDKRMRDLNGGVDAYAEAWAMVYYLMRRNPKEFADYLAELSTKTPMLWDKPPARRADFTRHLGEIDQFQADYLQFMQNVQ
jgi:hypothetical protein